MNAVPVAMNQVARQNLQSRDLNGHAKSYDVRIRVRHSDAPREEMKPHRFHRRQIAHCSIRHATNAIEHLSDGRMNFTYQCAHARHPIDILQDQNARLRHRGQIVQVADSIAVRIAHYWGR